MRSRNQPVTLWRDRVRALCAVSHGLQPSRLRPLSREAPRRGRFDLSAHDTNRNHQVTAIDGTVGCADGCHIAVGMVEVQRNRVEIVGDGVRVGIIGQWVGVLRRVVGRVAVVIDLVEIADYTIERFGIEQARRYRDDLESCFQTLAASPMIGRSADELGSNLRRYEHQSHIVFYLPSDQGVFVARASSEDGLRQTSVTVNARSLYHLIDVPRGTLNSLRINPSGESLECL